MFETATIERTDRDSTAEGAVGHLNEFEGVEIVERTSELLTITARNERVFLDYLMHHINDFDDFSEGAHVKIESLDPEFGFSEVEKWNRDFSIKGSKEYGVTKITIEIPKGFARNPLNAITISSVEITFENNLRIASSPNYLL